MRGLHRYNYVFKYWYLLYVLILRTYYWPRYENDVFFYQLVLIATNYLLINILRTDNQMYNTLVQCAILGVSKAMDIRKYLPYIIYPFTAYRKLNSQLNSNNYLARDLIARLGLIVFSSLFNPFVCLNIIIILNSKLTFQVDGNINRCNVLVV